MPRSVDWSQKAVYSEMPFQDQGNAQPLRFGKGEMKEPKGRGMAQFSLMNYQPYEFFENVFQWLGENCKGPWYFDEHWDVGRHRPFLLLHIDQKPDQSLFRKSGWGEYFDFREKTDYELKMMGIAEGVIPPYTAGESIDVWRDETLIRFFDYQWSEGDNPALVTFKDSVLETMFICAVETELGHEPQATNITQQYRVPPSLGVRTWLVENAIGIIKARYVPEHGEQRILVTFNNRDVADDFRQKLGHIFNECSDKPGTYEGPLPENTLRALPQILLDYIEGRVPTLHPEAAVPVPSEPAP